MGFKFQHSVCMWDIMKPFIISCFHMIADNIMEYESSSNHATFCMAIFRQNLTQWVTKINGRLMCHGVSLKILAEYDCYYIYIYIYIYHE